MRLAYLLPFIVVATPASAQTMGLMPSPGPTLVETPSVGPINGFYPDIYSPMRPLDRQYVKARALVGEGRYAEADVLLTELYGKTSSRQVRFLKGVTSLALGDAQAARRYFSKALPNGRSGDPGAMSGLALAEIKLGNSDAARDILVKLRYQQDKCGLNCDRAKPLKQAVAVVEKALI